ncbi:MAG: aminoglycoside phosphotransferase family protein [Candidatus Berkiella sp.]
MKKLEFKHWISEALGTEHFQINPLKGDASFRSYYRVHHADKSYIAMLAPPDKEKTDMFVAIAKSWKTYGLLVPTVWAWQPQQGFVLLSDFGDTLLLNALDKQSAPGYYAKAMQSLLPLQRAKPVDFQLPAFAGAHTANELGLFNEWFVEKLLGLSLKPGEQELIQTVFNDLALCVQEQPQVVIHRDYHSRNLMVLPDERLGVIDFQDAMMGPITYDLVSLLKDCYIKWPKETVAAWAMDFYHALKAQNSIGDVSFGQFMEWFDGVGLQRHLKVLGVFSRLKIRDNKAHYLNDIPRIMEYVLEVTQRYPYLQPFDNWLRQVILPILSPILAEHATSSDSKVA